VELAKNETRTLFTDLQTAELELLCKKRGRIRKAWSDVTLIGYRASGKGLLVSFAEET
jgi:hypothetical protein